MKYKDDRYKICDNYNDSLATHHFILFLLQLAKKCNCQFSRGALKHTYQYNTLLRQCLTFQISSIFIIALFMEISTLGIQQILILTIQHTIM